MSDINKFTTKEVLNKVLLDSSGNSVAANSHTSQEALNAVLDTSNNRLNVSLGGSNTISGDVTITGDLTVQGGGSQAFDEIVQGTFQIDASANTSNSAVLKLEAARPSSGQDSAEIRFYNQGGSDHDYARIVGVRGGANESGSLQFRTSEASTEVTGMTISSTGNIGIGTNSVINSTIGSTSARFLDVDGGSFMAITTLARSTTGNNNNLGSLQFVNKDNTDSASNDADGELVSYITSTVATSDSNDAHDSGANLLFYTKPETGTIAERMRIKSGGDVSFTGWVEGNDNNALFSNSSTGLLLQAPTTTEKIFFRDFNGTAGMTYDASNKRLGIGCDHPSVPLEVELSGDTGTYFEGGGSGNDASDLRHLTMTASTTSSAGDTHTLNAESGSGVLKFATSGSDRMIVNSTGVGIGISPSVPLHISKATDGGLTEIFINNSAGGGSTDETVGIRFTHNGATAGGILAGRTEDFSNSANRSGHLIFKTNNNDSYAERMRITSAGNVNIGTTDSAASSGAENLIVGSGSGSEGMTIYSGADNFGAIHFSDATSGDGQYKGIIRYGHGGSGEQMEVFANASKKMVIDANSRISLSNNDSGGTGGQNSTSSNTILGYKAGNAVASGTINNTFIGHNAGLSANDAVANVVVGTNSADALTTGDHNVTLGYFALSASTDVDSVVAIGSGAMESGNVTSDADGSVAIGRNSLLALISGKKNTAIGFESLKTNVDGDENTAVGYQALGTFEASSDGHGKNTAVGSSAGVNLTTGQNNTLMGAGSGVHEVALNTGSENTLIGSLTDVSTGGASNQTVIGYNASGQADNSVTLGNADVTAVYMAQDANSDNSTNAEGATVYAKALHLKQLSAHDSGGIDTPLILHSHFNTSPSGGQGTGLLVRMSQDDTNANKDVAKIGYVSRNGTLATNFGGDLSFSVVGGGTLTELMTLSGDSEVNRVVLPQGRLQFPATQNSDADANTLDDYEEGEYAPVLTCASSGTFGLDSGSNAFVYTKIGRQVHVQGEVQVTSEASSPSGELRLTLPFTTAVTQTTDSSDIAIGHLQLNASGTSLAGQLYCRTQGGLNYMTFRMRNDDCTETVLDHSSVDTNFYITINLTYNA